MATTAFTPEDVVRTIRAIDEQFERNFAAGDAVALVNGFYAENARLLPPNAPLVEGRAAITEAWRGILTAIRELHLDTTTIEVSGDLAYGLGRASLVTADGNSGMGKYVVVYKRQPDGQWRAVADVFNMDA